MTLAQTERLVNFCNKIKVLINEETGGYCAYFEYKDKQYYASIMFIKAIGPEIAIFPACDDYVTCWDYLYCNHPIDVSIKTLRENIYEFLETVNNSVHHKPKSKK